MVSALRLVRQSPMTAMVALLALCTLALIVWLVAVSWMIRAELSEMEPDETRPRHAGLDRDGDREDSTGHEVRREGRQQRARRVQVRLNRCRLCRLKRKDGRGWTYHRDAGRPARIQGG